MTLEIQDGIPVSSAESLRRPLTDEEMREIWGRHGDGVSKGDVEDLARILQSGDAESRALAEACLCALIYLEISDRMLDPESGYVSQLEHSISEAVDRFNGYIR